MASDTEILNNWDLHPARVVRAAAARFMARFGLEPLSSEGRMARRVARQIIDGDLLPRKLKGSAGRDAMLKCYTSDAARVCRLLPL